MAKNQSRRGIRYKRYLDQDSQEDIPESSRRRYDRGGTRSDSIQGDCSINNAEAADSDEARFQAELNLQTQDNIAAADNPDNLAPCESQEITFGGGNGTNEESQTGNQSEGESTSEVGVPECAAASGNENDSGQSEMDFVNEEEDNGNGGCNNWEEPETECDLHSDHVDNDDNHSHLSSRHSGRSTSSNVSNFSEGSDSEADTDHEENYDIESQSDVRTSGDETDIENPGDLSDQDEPVNDIEIPANEEEENVHQDHHVEPHVVPASHTTLQFALQEKYLETISTPITISRGEALLMAVYMHQKNNSSTKHLRDSVKLLNSLFPAFSPILPQTGFLLDKLLLSESGVHRHFYCKTCFTYFGELDHRNVHTRECENCETQNRLHDLTKAPHFVIYDVSVQLELLLKDPKIIQSLKTPLQLVTDRREGVYCDIYDGASYHTFYEGLVNVDADVIISFTFCADGSPLFSNYSTLSIWPLFLSINELPPFLRMHNLIIGALWFGNKEPPMDLFLLPFSVYMRQLSTEGMAITLNNERKIVKAFALLCCVDSGARGQIQGLKTHAGYSSCNWCLHPGEWDGTHVKFPNLNFVPQRRTHRSIVERANAVLREGRRAIDDGVNAATPLINLGPHFDLVNGMAVEYLHMVLLGVVKQFLKAWMKHSKMPYYIGSEETIAILNSKLQAMKPPVEVRRYPRDISAYRHWNARDLENWLLYYSVPVLLNVIPRKYMNHWLLLVQSMNLLLQREITHVQLRVAQEYIVHFCVITEQLYGVNSMSFNLHILKHLCDHVRRWGPIWAVSAFAFEAGNGTLKRLIHSQNGIPHQICRAISLKMAVQILERQCSSQVTNNFLENISKRKTSKCLSVDHVNYIGSSFPFRPTDDEQWLFDEANINTDTCVVFRKIIKGSCLYASETQKVRRTNNSMAQLNDKSILRVKKIVSHQTQHKGFILGCKVNCSIFRRLPQDPGNSEGIHYLLSVNFIQDDLVLVKVEDLFTVCFYSSPTNKLLLPVPNLLNVF